ncbi:hypothetical protein P7C70_g7671, partial [Phenoliferia sp. Uapishka_3]
MLRLRTPHPPFLFDFLTPAFARPRPLHFRTTSTTASTSTIPTPKNSSPSSSKPQPQPQRVHHGPPPIAGNSNKAFNRIENAKYRKANKLSQSSNLKPVTPPPPIATSSSSTATADPSRESAPRRKPLHSRPPSLSTSTDPVTFLSQIRATSPPSSSSPSSTAPSPVLAHNTSILHIARGGIESYTLGWLPIKSAGEANRVQPKDLGVVLTAAQTGLWNDQAEVNWKDVKELILWTVGAENGETEVNNWAWKELGKGVEGAERVKEVWEAIQKDEHIEVRNGRESIAKNWFPKIRQAPPQRRRMPELFAAFVVAKSVLYGATENPPPFRNVLPGLLAHGEHISYRHLEANYKRSTLALSSFPGDTNTKTSTTSLAHAWIRQVVLAGLWTQDTGGEGYTIVKEARLMFRTKKSMGAWGLWGLVKEAVESRDVAWIAVDQWEASGTRRWVRGSSGVEGELMGSGKFGQVLEDPEATKSEDDSTAAALSPPTPFSLTPKPIPTFIPASLTQALVATFLSGLTSRQMYDEAGDIWGWLSTRSPPLLPSVVLWTSLINGYAKSGSIESVESTLLQMSASGVKPDVWTWLDRAEAYFLAKRPDEAVEIVGAMFRDGGVLKSFEQDSRVPKLVYARIFVGLFRNGRAEEANKLLEEMEEKGTTVDIHILNIFLRHHTEKRSKPDFAAAIDIFRRIGKAGLEPDVFTFTMLLNALLKMGHQDATQRLISIMESTNTRPTVTTYGSVIAHLAQTGTLESLQCAVGLLDEMERMRMPTNEIIYTSLIKGFLRAIATTALPQSSSFAGRSESSTSLHPFFLAAQSLRKRMESRGLQLNRIGYNSIISSALASRSPAGIALAETTFKEMMEGGKRFEGEENLEKVGRGRADSWFVIIEGYANLGEWGRARALVGEMDRVGFRARSSGLRRLVDKVQRGGWAK